MNAPGEVFLAHPRQGESLGRQTRLGQDLDRYRFGLVPLQFDGHLLRVGLLINAPVLQARSQHIDQSGPLGNQHLQAIDRPSEDAELKLGVRLHQPIGDADIQLVLDRREHSHGGRGSALRLPAGHQLRTRPQGGLPLRCVGIALGIDRRGPRIDLHRLIGPRDGHFNHRDRCGGGVERQFAAIGGNLHGDFEIQLETHVPRLGKVQRVIPLAGRLQDNRRVGATDGRHSGPPQLEGQDPAPLFQYPNLISRGEAGEILLDLPAIARLSEHRLDAPSPLAGEGLKLLQQFGIAGQGDQPSPPLPTQHLLQAGIGNKNPFFRRHALAIRCGGGGASRLGGGLLSPGRLLSGGGGRGPHPDQCGPQTTHCPAGVVHEIHSRRVDDPSSPLEWRSPLRVGQSGSLHRLGNLGHLGVYRPTLPRDKHPPR